MENIYHTIRGRTKSPRTLESISKDPLSAAKPYIYIDVSASVGTRLPRGAVERSPFIHPLAAIPPLEKPRGKVPPRSEKTMELIYRSWLGSFLGGDFGWLKHVKMKF